MTMRAAIYARVSSAAQRERDTIESQLRVLPEYVKQQGWTLAGTYIDDGRTAKTGHLEAREGFARLVRDADAKLFELVVVVDIDRLTRTDDIEERAKVLGPFQRNGIDIVTINGGRQDLRSMMGEMYVTMQALFAAEENRKRSERIVRGKVTGAQRGVKTTGRGPWWLIYERAANTWKLHDTRAAIMREVFERAAAGEACSDIAIDLNNRGVDSPWKRPWHRGRIRDNIRARTAVGEYLTHRKSRTAISVPALVTEELWQAANAALTANSKHGLRRTRHVYLLEGIAVCGACGHPMRIRSAQKSRSRGKTYLAPAKYICGSKQHWIRLEERSIAACDSPPILVADADARAWTAVCRELEDPLLPAELAADRRAIATDDHDWARDAAGYEAHLKRLDKVAEGLLARFRRGVLSDEELDREIALVNRERGVVRSQLQAATRARGAVRSATARLNEASAMMERLRDKLATATPEERREIFAAVVDVGGAAFHGTTLHVELWVERPACVAAPERAASWSDDADGYLRIRLVA